MKFLELIIVLFSFFALALATEFHNADENVNITDPFLIEGDIRIRVDDRASLKGRLWPSGVVPYEYSRHFASYSSAVAATEAAMEVWSKVACVRFTRRTVERKYLSFIIGEGCYSWVGAIGRKQEISLGKGCHYEGIAVHELGHALGFDHEQNRLDRDDFVTINEQNIEKGREYNFRKHSRFNIDSLGTPYDYSSIMHYGPYAFSKNGYPTIVPKQAGVTIGNRFGPSTTDIKQMRKLYKCPDEPFVEYGAGCKWRFEKSAHRCWRYCNPNFPNTGSWCWTHKSCGSGFLGLAKGSCPGSVSFAECASSCGK